MDKTLVIMAAGMGTRYGGLKQLDIIGPSGETIIDYSVYDANRAGFNKVIFIIRKDIESDFKSLISSKFNDKIDVQYVYQDIKDIPSDFSVPVERKKPWGTGHAMLTAAPVVHEPFIVINADDLYGAEAFKTASDFLDRIQPGEFAAGLVGFQLKNTLSDHGSVARGICSADTNGILVDIEEIFGIERNEEGTLVSDNREGLKDNDLVSMNIWAFTPQIFRYTQKYFYSFISDNIHNPTSEFYIPTIINRLLKEEGTQVQVLKTDSQWYGVTYREDKPGVVGNIKRLIKAGVYTANLWGNQ
ncbi:MAG: nucleotidyltransferase [Spirochaetales bacterium]|nr:nucleotidyltransferase [Spirochaetales bacterium]